MGAFNILSTQVACINCKRQFMLRIQFKFGDTWQLEYSIGDSLNWGGNDKGEPYHETVMVYGIAEESICPYCGFKNNEEFDIHIENGAIKSIATMTAYKFYLDFEAGEGSFYYPK